MSTINLSPDELKALEALAFDALPEGVRRELSSHRDLFAAAKALMDSVNFDMVGIDGRGGNGGLISTDTMRRSDELRQVILRQETPHG